ncbi:hypothetical protein KEM48_004786 [Puccinia striiformis f. sp. tritici PST-130]|nr:hypothetical protein KEM48_004786 [Puccinia striiformis f. sp. tritici PST-130]
MTTNPPSPPKLTTNSDHHPENTPALKHLTTLAFQHQHAWPTPVLKPMSHFMIGGVITFYLVNKMQTAMLKSPEYAKDPRNPHVYRS